MNVSTGLDDLRCSAYTVPTETPESDGTLEWDSTTVIVVEAVAAGRRGLGYTYGAPAVASLIDRKLAALLRGREVMEVGARWKEMWTEIRNLGHAGIGAMAVSAVDMALWDLKAKILELPLVTVLDAVHQGVEVYGSGGFTSYTDHQLADQLEGWVATGISQVKMKVGRNPSQDSHRLAVARKAVGEQTDLFVDANGAYTRKQALLWAQRFADVGVRWLEEPVSSDDLEGLRLLRDTCPPGMDIAAGEYGYSLPYFAHMVSAGAVDCLQADVTRCGGMTIFRQAGALAEAQGIELSAHCAPQASAHVATSVRAFRHIEYFHDHVRLERLFFDGALEPTGDGLLVPDRSRPGMGLELKTADVTRYRVV